MSSFLMGYPHAPHIQNSMDHKYPVMDDYHHYNGYSMPSNGMGHQTHITADYMTSNHNSASDLHHQNYNYNSSHHQGITGYYSGYSPQVHTVPNNGYSTSSVDSYYSGFYGNSTSSSHTSSLDLPLQCPNSEPTNTVLGLQELGEFLFFQNRVGRWFGEWLNSRRMDWSMSYGCTRSISSLLWSVLL